MKALIDDLNSVLLERSDVVRGIMLGLLARKHVFLLGPPGTAKSMTVDQVASRVDGARTFSVLMTRFTTPDEIIGPVSLPALEQERYARVVKGYLPEAHIAFLDEVFKANSAILNALLKLLNEREYRNDGATHKAPLITCIGASNELPQGEDLGALYDRFLLRYYVPYIVEESNFAKLLEMTDTGPRVRISLPELGAAQQATDAVQLGEGLDALVELRAKLKGEGIEASDRTWRACVSVLKAEAFLDGRSVVQRSDLSVLANVLWNDPSERSKVAQKVVEFSQPNLAAALEMLDMAAELHRKIMSTKPGERQGEFYEAVGKLRALQERFARELGRDNDPKVKSVALKLDAMRKDVAKAVL